MDNSLKKILEEKNKRLSSVPDEFFLLIKEQEKKIILSIIDKLNKLDVDRDGNFVLSKKNLILSEQINDDLKDVFIGRDYIKAVKQFAGEFDNQKKINETYFKTAFPDFKENELAKQLIVNSKKQAVQLLVGDDFSSSVITPLKEVITDAVNTGSGFKDTVSSIQRMIQSSSELDGNLLRYSKQIAVDSFSISDRSFTNILSDDLDSEWFIWGGGIIAPTFNKKGRQTGGTRCFCLERVNNYFHYKEIESWGNGQTFIGVKQNCGFPWAGMNNSTNGKTIFAYAGGYNCQHSIMPVSVFSVPKDVIIRNINQGFFNPSEKLKQMLGL